MEPDSEPAYRVSVREVIVDVLGSLVPGLIFVCCSVVLLAWPFKVALTVLLGALGAAQSLEGFYITASQFVSALRIELTILIVMIAYVAGHLFYRQDPHEPDVRSFNRMATAKEDWVADRGECQFPYRHFDRYLISRGLLHLVPLADWCRTGFRTKYFLNTLKVRLFFEYPEHCASIAKNEAHVRLMSSTWYMARALFWLSVGIMIAMLGVAIVGRTGGWNLQGLRSGAQHLIPAIPALLAAMLALGVRWIIERFLHYQRVREVFWVLETAYVAYRDTPERLRDVCPFFGATSGSPPTLQNAATSPDNGILAG